MHFAQQVLAEVTPLSPFVQSLSFFAEDASLLLDPRDLTDRFVALRPSAEDVLHQGLTLAVRVVLVGSPRNFCNYVIVRLLLSCMVTCVRIGSQKVSGKLIDFRLLLGCMVASVRIGSQQVSSKLIDLHLLFGYFTTSLTHSSNIL